MSKENKTNNLFFDVETTGLPPKGAKYDENYNEFPYIVQFSWFFEGKMKDYIIKPNGYIIPESAAAIHGITTEIAIEKGVDLLEVMLEFAKDAIFSDKVIAHNIYFDSSVIKANAMRLVKSESIKFPMDKYNGLSSGIDKTKRIDTMFKTIKFVNAKYANGRGGKWPKLEELYFKLFEESFPAHNSAEDVKALKKCYDKLVELEVL